MDVGRTSGEGVRAWAAWTAFGAKGSLEVGDESYEIYRLSSVSGEGSDVASLPYSLKVLLENLLRTEDGATSPPTTSARSPAGTPTAEPEQGDPVHAGAGDHAGLHRCALRSSTWPPCARR